MIAGLGNPGREYSDTPHNVGFAAVASICQTLGGEWRIEPKFKADVAKVSKGGEQIMLVRPITYMNASGEAIGGIMRYFRMEPADVVVVCDDVNLAPGRIRVRASGGDGGHNGLKSVTEHLGTQDFARVRIGVGRGTAPRDSGLIGHVLGRIPEADATEVAHGIETAAKAALCATTEGLVKAMDTYNAAPKQESDKEDKTQQQKQQQTNKTNEPNEQLNSKEKTNAQEI